MVKKRSLHAGPVLVLAALLLLQPGAVDAQAAGSYRPAVPGDTILESRSGLRLRPLVDWTVLGGDEVDMAELVFPGGARAAASHRHGSTEIFYVLSGVLDHVVNGKTFQLQPGMVGVVRAGDRVAHSVASEEPVHVLAIWAPGGELARIRPAFRPVEGDEMGHEAPVADTISAACDAPVFNWLRDTQP